MEQFIQSIASWASILVPLLAAWAIIGLYTQRHGCQCIATQALYLSVMLFIAGITLRTVMIDDGCWLIHMASLGVLAVAGVMRRPESQATEFVSESLSI